MTAESDPGASPHSGQANRLEHEDSPYLLQHASNPVDWYPWGSEAFSKAAREGKPIFLSIGYSACHWCHVMERESFENPDIADFLNRHFVSVKVDREERPDVDRIYMEAVQLMTGSGGWPLSVFLTPDLRPFYGGTYFPPEGRYGIPGFKQVLTEINRMWDTDREKLIMGAAQILRHLSDSDHAAVPDNDAVDWTLVQQGTKHLAGAFDSEYGGFGKAPKFPPAGALELLLREYHRTQNQALLDMATQTLDCMARGGIFDQLGGGFHRYSVDSQWLVPHFEKMLYDNALLATVYTHAYQLTANPLYREVATRTLDFVLREMTGPDGPFYSSIDADSDGQEGAFYVWSAKQVDALLDQNLSALVKARFGITEKGNFEGKTILTAAIPVDQLAERFELPVATVVQSLEDARKILMNARGRRARPNTDDKQLTSWNGLMIRALTEAHRAFGIQRFGDAAHKAARTILKTMVHNGNLLHSRRNGRVKYAGNADDYAYFCDALLALYSTTGDIDFLEQACTLAETFTRDFWDFDRGGFFYTEEGREHIISREKCFMDEAIPSANAIAARALEHLGRLTERETFGCMAAQALVAAAPMARIYPGAFMNTFVSAAFCLAPPAEVTLAGNPAGEDTRQLLYAYGKAYQPNTVLAVWNPEGPDAGRAEKLVPWLRGRGMVAERATAYVCRNRTCLPPTNAADDLLSLMTERKGQ